MSAPSSLSIPVPQRRTIRPLWSQAFRARLRGLAMAREKGALLVWDENHWLYLVNRAGTRQAQMRPAGTLVAACCADDGSAYVAIGSQGEVWWLAPDLSLRWERGVSRRTVAAAVDPFGQYLAVADSRSSLHIFDRQGRLVSQGQSPRPLHHLAFVPAAPLLLGCADYGLVACFDLAGNCVWRDGLVAHMGSLAVSGDGSQVTLACFTEGLQRYDLKGKKQPRWSVGEACRHAAVSFDGRHTLVATLSNRLLLLDRNGQTQCSATLESPPVAIALGALADSAFVALAEGTVLGHSLRDSPRS